MIKLRNIYVTGITGFVGKNFVKYIENTTDTINVVEIDLRSENWKNKLQNCDVILHLAGKAHDLKNITKPEDYFNINTELTKEVYTKFLESSAQTFIFISSVKAAVDSIDYVLDENEPTRPSTIYGQSKLLAEKYILNSLPNLGSEKRVYILRPCIIHGPYNKGNLITLYKYIRSGFPWPLGKYNNVRSYCSILNLCFVLKELSERNDILSGIYNVADNEVLSTNDLVSFIAKLNNTKIRIFHLPRFIVSIFAKIGDILNLPFNSEKLIKLTENFQVSNRKLTIALKKNFPVSLEEGLLYTFNSNED